MPLRINELTADSIEDATAYWLYSDDGGWQQWRLIQGSQVVSPNGEVLRMMFELEGDSFELALLQKGPRIHAKFDDRENPQHELLTRVFEAADEALVLFVYKDETVFVHLELAA